MDGISVAASIIGLLAAAAKISSTLNDFIVKVREAPKLARTVLLEIADISACLNQVQSLLLGVGSINASNQSLLMVNDLDVILSNCVVIFSELEELAEGLKPDQPIQAIDILKWTIKEKAITALLLRLQSSKTSLSLMISALTCSSIEDARGAVDQLTGIVRELLESNRDTYERLGRIESKNLETITISSRTTHDLVHESITEDDESAVTTRRLKTGSPPQNAHEIATSNYTFDFEQLLESSRPYVRASKRPQPPASATSSTIQTLGWSCLSGISLAKVSNISIIELTVDKEQLWNSTRYDSRHPVLGTLSEGGIVRIFSDIRSHFIFDLIRCQGCGRDQEPTENSWKRLEEPANIYAASFVTGSATGSPTSLANRNWWHIDCIRYCLPDCFIGLDVNAIQTCLGHANVYFDNQTLELMVNPHMASRYGLTEIYHPPDGSVVAAHIVFVHGLFGHPFKTWGAAKSRWRWRSTSKSRSSKVEVSAADHQFEYESKIGEARFWPQQLLPKVIPSTRIFTWGYDADIDGFLASASQNTQGNLFMQKAIPLIFVAHNLGGIIVKDALNQSRLTEGTRLKEITPATFAVLFLGTPHRGSRTASLRRIAYNITTIATKRPNVPLLRALERNVETLDRIGDAFSQTMLRYKIQVYSFREEKKTRKYLIFNTMVVEADSAKIGDAREEVSSIPTNHEEMTKFSSSEDVGLKRISAQLRRWIGEIKLTSGKLL
ncbi:MAG: hypothetical protein LQ342_006330 [Letrouitia transgressa]|nr:MAG: hypothetical protein LQ342_006330 [Letrouitia transgressa]